MNHIIKKVFLAGLLVNPLVGLTQVTMEGGVSGFQLFETPYGTAEVGAVDNMISSTRDDRFNRTIIRSPAFTAEASAIGNNISVVNSGSGNTTVINAQQTNTGSQTAIVSFSSRLRATSSSGLGVDTQAETAAADAAAAGITATTKR